MAKEITKSLAILALISTLLLTVSALTQDDFIIKESKDNKILKDEAELAPKISSIEEFLESIKVKEEAEVDLEEIKEIADNTKEEIKEIDKKIKDIAISEVKKKAISSENIKVIVWVKKEYSYKTVLKSLKDFKVSQRFDNLNGFSGTTSRKTLDKLNLDKRVDYIAFDATLKTSLAESIPLIQADIVSTNFSLNGERIGICHLDTGINYNIPELAHAYAGGYDFVNGDSDPFDDNGHGTVTAGVIVSNNPIEKGVSPEARLYAIKVLNSSGFGFSSSLTAGIDWCITNKDLYNISVIIAPIATFETYNQSNHPGYSEVALQAAHNTNLPVVVCTGNTANTSGVAYPAVSPYVIPVSGVYDSNVGPFNYYFNNITCNDQSTSVDQIPCFANRADFVKILAPASIITTTSWFGGTMDISGTSVAAPHVAATIALMKQRNPQMTISQIKNILENTGVNIYDNSTGLNFKRINSLEAVKAVPFIEKFGNLSQGNNITINISDPMNPGAIYFTVLSFGKDQGIPLSNGLILPLNPDGLFSFSLIYPNPILVNNIGILDSNGKATITFLVPQLVGIENLTIYTGFATAKTDLSEFLSVSNSVKL